ncbi:MAG: hypothetical protein LBQ28_10705 [Prevotellaceae bacterium]|jgi:hypothetical protein|nr:hypothetical protein [Prevotellaceae bacterium]
MTNNFQLYNFMNFTTKIEYPVRDLSSVENKDKSMLRTEHCRFFIEPQVTRAPRIGVAFFYRPFMPTAY